MLVSTAVNRRWLLTIIALVLVSGFYLIGPRVTPADAGRTLVSTGEDAPPEDGERQSKAWVDYDNEPKVPGAGEGTTPKDNRPVSEPGRVQARPVAIPAPISENLRIKENPSMMLVVMRRKAEGVQWVDDLVNSTAHLYSTTYYYDDPARPTHVTHGRAMVYLQYILDNYDTLADITLFAHATQINQHLGPVLNNSLTTALETLNTDKVQRDGFLNLRCAHDPGCPSGTALNPPDKSHPMAAPWREFFGAQQPPAALSTPQGGGQYAVTRDRIRALSRADYEYLHARMSTSKIPQDELDTFWTYAWHYLWTGQATLCPDEAACYCEGYAICFADGAFTDQAANQEELERLRSEVDAMKKAGGAGMEKEREKNLERIARLEDRMNVRVTTARMRGEQKRKGEKGLPQSLHETLEEAIENHKDGDKPRAD